MDHADAPWNHDWRFDHDYRESALLPDGSKLT